MPLPPTSPSLPGIPRGTRSLQLFARGVLGLGVPLVLLVTLTPGSSLDLLRDPGPCILCGDAGLANLLRNVILFLPLGVAGGILTGGVALPAVAAVLLSGGIEVAQIFVPGRNPLLIDLVANVLGGVLGALVGRWLLGLSLGVRRVRDGWGSHPRSWAAASALVLALTGWLLTPAPPPPPYHVIHTARHGHMEAYEGRVLDARVDGVPLVPGRVDDPERIRTGILDGGTVEILVEAAPPPPSLAPILSVHTGDQAEVFLLGVDGADLVLRLPYRASALRLARGELRAPGALQGVAQGDTVGVAVETSSEGASLVVGSRVYPGLRPELGEGWALLYFPPAMGRPLRALITLLWMMALGFPAGFLSSGARERAALAAGLFGVAVGVGLLPSSFPAVSLPFLLGLPLGVLAGGLLRRGLGGTQSALSPGGTTNQSEGARRP